MNFSRILVSSLYVVLLWCCVECNEPEFTIHWIPHSHQDVGWYQTPEGYYQSRSKNIKRTSIIELDLDKEKTFVEIEMYFIHRFFKDATQEQKTLYKRLVKDKQLEIISGGWCSNDEATTYYDDIINQYMYGHKFAHKEFGIIPRIAWHLDQFGHSAGMASILGQFGFEVFFFTREDISDKSKRTKEANLQFVWNPNKNYEWNLNVFTHSYFHHYSPIDNLCFDDIWGCPDASLSRANSYLNSLEAFVKQSKSMNKGDVKDFLLLEGDDFNFQNANDTFKSTDIVVKYMKENAKNFKLIYSTPSNYYNALFKTASEKGIEYNVFREEFFPYKDGQNAYWTGFYTTRPQLKGQIRKSSKIYHAVQKLASLYTFHPDVSENTINGWRDKFSIAEEALANAQHHDAATGTCSDQVAENYKHALFAGYSGAGEVGAHIMKLIAKELFNQELSFKFCDNIDSTIDNCAALKDLSPTKSVILGMFNPSKKRPNYVRIPVKDGNLKIFNEHEEEVKADVICEHTNHGTSTECNLYFEDIFEAVETKFYFIKYSNQDKQIEPINGIDQTIFIYNEFQQIEFLGGTEWEYCLKPKGTGFSKCEPEKLELDYKYYPSYSRGGQNSGIYIFRSESRRPKPFINELKSVELFRGNIIKQVTIVYDSVVLHLRLFNHMEFGFELESQLFGLKLGNERGREVILTVKPKFSNSNSEFWTDSNGMSMQKHTTVNEGDDTIFASLNYRPINTAISMKSTDGLMQLTILNDRAQGASYIDEAIEIMVHRAVTTNDNRGLPNTLTEYEHGKPKRIRVRHKIIIEELKKQEPVQRDLERGLFEAPIPFYGEVVDNNMNAKWESNSGRFNYSWLEDVKFNFFVEDKNTIFVRLFNIRDEFDHLNTEQRNPMIDVHKLANDIWHTVNSQSHGGFEITEMSLNHVETIMEMKAKRKQWPTNTPLTQNDYKYQQDNDSKHIQMIKSIFR